MVSLDLNNLALGDARYIRLRQANLILGKTQSKQAQRAELLFKPRFDGQLTQARRAKGACAGGFALGHAWPALCQRRV